MEKNDKINALALLGPTASGKTQALKLLDYSLYEIISCDSRQIYKGLEITTVAPEKEFQEKIPHHFVSCLSPLKKPTAGKFVEKAKKLILEIQKRKKIPLICGGNNFYFQALSKGMFSISENLEVKKKISKMSKKERYEQLKKLDLEALESKRIHKNDDYRITRALEIIFSSNKKLSTFWKEWKENNTPELKIKGFFFQIEKEKNLIQIKARAQKMIKDGMIEEVGKLYEMHNLCPALETIGCQDALSVYKKELDTEELLKRLCQNHAYYAKKQRTWLQKEKNLKPISSDNFLIEWKQLENDYKKSNGIVRK